MSTTSRKAYFFEEKLLQKYQYKGDKMLLSELAEIRTGLVLARKKAKDSDLTKIKYNVLNLKCIMNEGYLDLKQSEEIEMKERLNPEYLTQKNDILIRLSSPYTVIYITDEKQYGYVIPSHFAIVRTDEKKTASEYIYWFLKRDFIYQKIIKNISGNTAFGTISSGFFANLTIRNLPFEKQKTIGTYLLLADKEQKLLKSLAKQKELLNKAVTNRIYETIKRGNKQ